MPMLKRSVEPHHVCRTEIPECIERELECVNNAALSSIIRQLSSLSKHAEDIFAELFQQASVFYTRTVSLQDRIDRLAAKVTQLDPSVEEVSLQDIHLRKSFHSCTAQDQQVVSKGSIPSPIAQMYRHSDQPPPLGVLTQYRDDGVDAIRLYSDPSYFFDLWKERMMLDTEEKRRERRRQKEQKRGLHGTLPREVKRVRKARDRREEWNRLALDKELRPDRIHTQTLSHTHTRVRASHATHTLATVRFAGDCRPTFHEYPPTQPILTNHRPTFHEFPPTQPILTNHRPPQPSQEQAPAQRVEHEYHSIGGEVSIAVVYRAPAVQPPHAHTAEAQPPLTHTLAHTHTNTLPQTHTHGQHQNPTVNGCGAVSEAVIPLPTDYGMMECYSSSSPPPPLPPVIPSPLTAFASPPASLVPSLPLSPSSTLARSPPSALPLSSSSLPPNASVAMAAPPAPPPVPPLPTGVGMVTSDARSDLLAAIRVGIQLKKVQEQKEQKAKRQPIGDDVAAILSRRIAVEISDSEEGEESDGEGGRGWSD